MRQGVKLRAALRLAVGLLLAAARSLAQTASASPGPALSVDAAAQNHPISPDIYGINDYSDQGLAQELRLSVRRWGGDQTRASAGEGKSNP